MTPVPRPLGSPEIIAHRGSSDLLAEHTLAAYQRAITDGADGLECDVRLTADGVLVCVHDRRIDRTSDGSGLVSTKTYAELYERDYGSWKDPWLEDLDEEGPSPDASVRKLLRLEQLLELVLETPRPINLAIETKHPVRYGGLVEERVADLVRHFGFHRPVEAGPRVRLMSFSEGALRRMHQLVPTVQTVLLMERVPIRARGGLLPGGARIAGPGIHLLREDPTLVAKMHSVGTSVHVWTVNEPPDIDLCLELGVEGIITNRPAAVLDRIGRGG
jgi:glycerophosphoryl diester phosphodiesterase